MDRKEKYPGLYDPRFEHDNCGIGAVANIKGLKTHETVDQALHIVENLEHPGRKGRRRENRRRRRNHASDFPPLPIRISIRGNQPGRRAEYGIGMFFFPQDELARNQAMKMFEIIVKKEGLNFLGWRVVPTAPENLGKKALDVMPYIAQGFVEKPENVEKGLDFDRPPLRNSPGIRAEQRRYLCSVSFKQPYHRVQGYVPGGPAAPVLPGFAG